MITGVVESTQPYIYLYSVTSGESPPPPPRACFGRNELIEKIVDFAEILEPVALIGTGGIGKTSIALSVLHQDRIKDRFHDNRRFIRCDEFPPSCSHFLTRLSEVVGAGVENPRDLASLRPFLSSREMFVVLDNTESILDPQGTDAREIYSMVDELCRFKTIFVCVTSRITTIPQHCKRLVVPTLSAEAACETFYSIYNDCERSGVIDDLLKRLDYHALSTTLLATTASHNMWDCDELANEWDTRRAQVLRTDYSESLAATIELSLASPTFRKLGPDARELLGVIAFFPHGVHKKNLDWLFPTIHDRRNIFNKFCVLSLTCLSNGFITMLAPIRAYLYPRDPGSSPLLRATKDKYFARLPVGVDPGQPEFGRAEWLRLEDVNVEHLLDVFMPIDTDVGDALDACARFMGHLYWQKSRRTVLGPKIEGLPDGHRCKTKCLFELSRSLGAVGDHTEQKRLLSQVLKLDRERGDDRLVAQTLRWLCDANRMLGLYEEGIQQARKALEIYERLDDTAEQAESWRILAWLLYDDKQLDAAEEAVTRAIGLFPEKGEEFPVCQCHELLGDIYRSKRKRNKAIHHYEIARKIASPLNWHTRLFWVHYSLALLFQDEGAYDNACVHVKQAKLYAARLEYLLGCSAALQTWIWYRQGKLEDARSEILRASEIYEKLGSAKDVWRCRELLQKIEQVEKQAHNPPNVQKMVMSVHNYRK